VAASATPPPVQTASLTASLAVPAPAVAARPQTDTAGVVSAAASGAATPPISTGTTGMAPAPAQIQSSRPSQVSSQTQVSSAVASLSPQAADNTADAAASTAPDRGLAWPNPNATKPPSFAAPAASAPRARTASIETVPPGAPIAGRIPLPRQRPAVVAVAANMAHAAIPLPRDRPSAVPAEPAYSSDVYRYRPGLGTD
jgi:hypothetical protein